MKSVVIRSFRLFLLVLLPLIAPVTLGGCFGKETAPPTAVEWPELIRFDALLRESAQLAASGETVEVIRRRNTLLEAGWAVAPPSVPANVADMEKVRPLLGDLVSKLNGLAVPSLEPVKLNEIILGIRPILIELMDASGVERP
jgi:hypothetical protein